MFLDVYDERFDLTKGRKASLKALGVHLLVCVVSQSTRGAGVCLQFVGLSITRTVSSRGNNARILIRS